MQVSFVASLLHVQGGFAFSFWPLRDLIRRDRGRIRLERRTRPQFLNASYADFFEFSDSCLPVSRNFYLEIQQNAFWLGGLGPASTRLDRHGCWSPARVRGPDAQYCQKEVRTLLSIQAPCTNYRSFLSRDSTGFSRDICGVLYVFAQRLRVLADGQAAGLLRTLLVCSSGSATASSTRCSYSRYS